MFTDASMQGWGAVLNLPTGEVYATGAPWINQMEINAGEAIAVERALNLFQHHWQKFKNIHLRIDNTSVLSALRKKWSDSEGISSTLKRLIEFQDHNKVNITQSYVRSRENLADSWSREFY